MSTTATNSKSKKPVYSGLIVFLLLLALTQFLTYQRYQLNKAMEQREVTNAINATKDRLQAALSNSLAATKTLAFIVEKYGAPTDFDEVAKPILETNKYIDAIQLVEGGVITKVYPLKGNEAVIGYDIFKNDKLAGEALKAIEKKELFFSGPFELKQGGIGVVGRQPIYIKNKFRGFAAVVIRLPTLLKAAGINSADNNHFLFQLSKTNPTTNEEEFFLPHPEKFKTGKSVFVEVPDGDWNLYVLPKTSRIFSLVIPFALLGLLLSLTGGVFAWYITSRPQELDRQVKEKTRLIEASEINYRTTMGRVSDAFVALDKEWRYTFLNDAALSTHPDGRENTLGKVIWDVHPGMKGTIFWDKYHEAMETGKVTEVESMYDPMNLWFSVKIYPSHDGITIFYKDITLQKIAEQAIIREKNLSESIINSLPGAFYLYDQTGKFLRWNKNFETVTEYSSDEIRSMHPLDFFHEDEKQLLIQKIQSVFSGGMDDVEANLLTKSKTKIPYYFNGWVTEYEGKPCLLGVGMDITKNKNAEHLILVEKELSDTIINSLPGVFYLTGENGIFLRWNKNFETVSGYTGEELATMRGSDFFDADEKQAVVYKKSLALKDGSADLEANFVTKNGIKIPYYFTGRRLVYDGKTTFLGVGIDISERKKAETALSQMNEQLRQLSTHLESIREEERTHMAREIHDELGQQLTGLKMDIAWIKNKSEKEFHFPLLREKTNDMIDLVNEAIRSVRKIAKELRPGILDDLGLEAAIEWQAKEFEERTGIKFTVRALLNGENFSKEINTAVFRIFQESLTNIARHSEATAVEVNISRKENNLTLEVIDNGKGISDERKNNRTSFGLLGMKERAAHLNGSFSIEKHSGGGTITQVTIPLPA